MTLLSVVIFSTIYFLPGLVALTRHMPNAGSVMVLNLFLGWTFVVWVVALAMAVGSQPQQLPRRPWGESY